MKLSLADKNTCSMNIEHVLKKCGNYLLELSGEKKLEGEWIGGQFKSLVDLIAQNIIVDGIKDHYPSVPIVSEEDLESHAKVYPAYFLIDPIDGTASFVNGYDGWVCQIALIFEERPIVCGIYAPALGKYYSAIQGQGAFCNNNKISCNNNVVKESIESIVDNYPKPNEFILNVIKALKIKNYIECGGIALKSCLVAEGIADVFLKNMQPKDWDLGPPMLILEESGGVMSDINGHQIKFGTCNRTHEGLIVVRNFKQLHKVLDAISIK